MSTTYQVDLLVSLLLVGLEVGVPNRVVLVALVLHRGHSLAGGLPGGPAAVVLTSTHFFFLFNYYS